MMLSRFIYMWNCECWLQEIADNPQLFVEGATRFDVQQGELGEWQT
jgi:hypothetical protein